jgi:pimeloyl-ACP methyl ester carboxylesterase
MANSKIAIAFLLAALCSHASSAATCKSGSLALPQPLGRTPVGTRTLVLADAARRRELLVTTWFPAESGTVAAPYMEKRTAAELAREWKLQFGFEQSVCTHAWLDAAIVHQKAFPVVLLEHGSGVVPAIYTVLAEGLASSGFIVVATNHPPDSLIAVYPDGHVIKAQPYWPENADRRTQGVAIGKFAEDVLVADVRFILDQLQRLNSDDGFWRGHLDLSRVAIVGHSMGGTTAAIALKEDGRIRAGVNLDGSTYPGMNADVRPIRLGKPFLFMETEEHASDPETHGKEFVGSETNTYYAVVRGNEHMAFTDAPLLHCRFSTEPVPGTLGCERALEAVELTRSLVNEFVGKYLNEDPAPELGSLVRIDHR